MSHEAYLNSRVLDEQDYSIEELLLAAMRVARGRDLVLLIEDWPLLWRELKDRQAVKGDRLPTDP